VSLELRVHDEPAEEASRRLVAAARAGGHLALCGGSTPREAYARAAELEGDWRRATLWWGDERCVPPHDGRSNYRLAYESLVSRVARPPRVERIEGERGSEEAATRYEAALEREFDVRTPTFDLLLLGLGPDGHCASLFPGAPSVAVVDRRVVGVERAGLAPFVPRVSLTVPELSAARETLFLVTGESKAHAVRRAFGPNGDDVPARRVAERAAQVTVLLDAPAARELATGDFGAHRSPP
jgi:6-phosphogluconolactonase